MALEKMKLTQRETALRGKSKVIYIKPDVEKKALETCEKEKLSMSMLIRLSLIEYMEKRGYYGDEK